MIDRRFFHATAIAAGVFVAVSATSPRAAPPELAPPAPPLVLPSGSSAEGTSKARHGRWIIGATLTSEAQRIARHAGASAVLAKAGIFTVPIAQAAELARRLAVRGLLEFAEPNVR